jgi:hypothetical protein
VWIDGGEHTVPAGEVRGRHEGEEVGLVDEHREGGGVQERHHAWVLRDEGPRGHVEADHGGAVCADAGREEPIAPAGTVEELNTVAERTHHQRAVAARTSCWSFEACLDSESRSPGPLTVNVFGNDNATVQRSQKWSTC